jgi:hypothetical protein
MTSFDYFKFKEKINKGDLNGLEYLEDTLIKELKEKNKNTYIYTKEDYIINLFYAVKHLNECNDIYETSGVKNKFNCDLYFETKRLLLEELGLLSLFD